MSPLVSIVIPCYNAEKYIGDAIRSALAQTYRNKEVIVVDDGSTDRSLELVKTFGGAIRWESGPNRGGSAARNRGVALAGGEIIQFLDADDLLDPAKVERQVELLASDRNSLVFCDARIISGATGRPLAVWGRSQLSSDDPIIYLLNSPLPTEAPLHWKDNLLKVGGWSEGLPAGQDPDLHLRLACAGIRFVHLRERLLTVRRVENSVSHRFALKGMVYWRQSAVRSYDDLLARGLMTEERLRAFAGYFAGIGRRYLRHGMRALAEESFTQARAIHPDGGIPQAYGDASRKLYHIVGPVVTERLVGLKRRLSGGAHRA